MLPKKLQAGDQVRVIAPSTSMSIISDGCRKFAKNKFEEMGLKVTFGKHIDQSDEFTSSPISSRVSDLHSAFLDPNIKAVFTAIGGYNANQLLDKIDYNLIKNNPKIFCGYSDITALSNAIYAKTGLVTYSGPHYSTFGMQKHSEYNIEYFKKCLMQNEPYLIEPSPDWSDDKWYLDQENRNIQKNEGYWIINKGNAYGKIIGGNIGTINLLFGTSYLPDIKDSILFLEECYSGEINPIGEFVRLLESLTQQLNFDQVKALVIGRFQVESKINQTDLKKIIADNDKLKNIPIIANVDFGHANPIFTFPIGGTCNIQNGQIKIEKH